MGLTAALIGGTVASSLIGGISANKAAKAQQEAAEDANETQRYIFDRSVELTEPSREIGLNALQAMAFELGIGPRPVFDFQGGQTVTDATGTPVAPATTGIEGNVINAPGITEITTGGAPSAAALAAWQNTDRADRNDINRPRYTDPVTSYRVGDQSFDSRDAAQSYLNTLGPDPSTVAPVDEAGGYQGFQATPGYQFRFDEGQKALERMASARGLRLGSSTLKEAARFGEGLAADEYNNYWNRLAGVSGTGQTANSQQIAAGQNYANAYGQNALAGGQAAASGYLGVNNAAQGGINNLFSILGMRQAGFLDPGPRSNTAAFSTIGGGLG